MEVEPLDHMKLEDLDLNTSTHDLFLSSRGFPSVDEPEPQPLSNLPFLDVNLGDKRGTNPPINQYSLDPGDGVKINPDGVARYVHALLLIGMERGFLSSKGSVEGRGVKEKNGVTPSVKDGIAPSVTITSGNNSGTQEADSDTSTGLVTESDGIAVATKVASPSVVDETMKKEKQSSLVDTTGLGSYSPLHTQETTTAGNTAGKSSYANVTGKPSETKVNFHTLFTPGSNGIDVVVLVESIRAISKRFANTAYGFFLGKRVAYLVVSNYVRNTWGSMDGLDSMLKNGMWLICNNPLILKKWHPDENLLKEDVSTVPVWVKLDGVPVTVFSKDELSAIATKHGTPLMLDSYTSDMCMQSWGRSSYVRAMIELRTDVDLKDNIMAAMLKITREGTIHVIFVLTMSGNLLCVRVVRFLAMFKRNVLRI
ncbi:retrotransposon protein, putative, ty1-copia subclass [Tanacetum coccineum]